LKNPNSAVSTIEPSSESSPLHKGPAQRLPISHRGDHVLRPICQPHPLTRIGFFPVIVPYGSKSSEKKKEDLHALLIWEGPGLLHLHGSEAHMEETRKKAKAKE
jgi:hypothetical protein